MAHYIKHLDPTRMFRVETALQHFQENPRLLERNRHRFSVSPPPYESPPITEPPSPSDLLAQRSAYEKDELFRQPFSNLELWQLRSFFSAYHPGEQFAKEAEREQERIYDAYCERNEEGWETYSGPNLIGRAGQQRCFVMVRHAIKKRWERLGVWNAAWGIPNRVNKEDNDKYYGWRWEWAEPNIHTIESGLSFDQKIAQWPSIAQETAGERAVRQFIQERKRWNDDIQMTQGDSQCDGEVVIDPRERFITSRPWFQYQLEIEEEAKRLYRIQGLTMSTKDATTNTKARWQRDGRWKDTWGETPGWKWRDESASPEPEDPSNMDYSPSEIDALEAVPPPTPPPPPCPFVPSPVGFRFGSAKESFEHNPNLSPEEAHKQFRASIEDILDELDARDALDALGSDAAGGLIASVDNVLQSTSNASRDASTSQLADQRSTKRPREAEDDTQHDDHNVSAGPKRVKFVNQVAQSESPNPRRRFKNPPKHHDFSQSRSGSGKTADAPLGTLWLDIASLAPLSATNATSDVDSPPDHGQAVKLRRSARIVGQNNTKSQKDNAHVHPTAAGRAKKSRAPPRTKKSEPRFSKPSKPSKLSKPPKPSRVSKMSKPAKPSKQFQPPQESKSVGNTRKTSRGRPSTAHKVEPPVKARRPLRR